MPRKHTRTIPNRPTTRTVAAEPTIRDRVQRFIRDIGHDPNKVIEVTIDPTTIHVNTVTLTSSPIHQTIRF